MGLMPLSVVLRYYKEEPLVTRNEKNVKQLSEQLNTTKQDKIAADKLLLSSEIIIGVLSVICVLICASLAILLYTVATTAALVFAAIGFVPFVIGCAWALRIEQLAGYYKCKHCGNRHVPTYRQMLWTMHFGRTRYMKCPNCNKRSWQKKVLTKD